MSCSESWEGQRPPKLEGISACHAQDSSCWRYPRIWVLVTDGRKASVFSKCRNGSYLVEAIQQGRAIQDSKQMAVSGRNLVRRRLLPRKEMSLAHDISAWLDEEALKGSFDRLILVAASAILDELRHVLSQQVYAHIIAEINKDLSKMGDAELREELDKILWF